MGLVNHIENEKKRDNAIKILLICFWVDLIVIVALQITTNLKQGFNNYDSAWIL